MEDYLIERFWTLYDNGIRAGLIPEVAYGYAALSWWGEHYGMPAPRITSGRRDRSVQERLWANRASNPYPVARPGTSKHERGEAFDLPSGPHNDIYGHWSQLVGLRWGGNFSRPDPIHYEING